VGCAEGGASEAAESAIDTCQKFIIRLFTEGIDPFRMVNERLKGKMIVDIIFLFFESHLARIKDIVGIKGFFYGPHDVQSRT